jgi:hypothetical protein
MNQISVQQLKWNVMGTRMPFSHFPIFFMAKNDRIELNRVLFSDKMSTSSSTNKLVKTDAKGS